MLVGRHLGQGILRRHLDDVQRLAEFMRHAGGNLSQGDELCRLGNGVLRLVAQCVVVPDQDGAVANLRKQLVRRREMQMARGLIGRGNLEINLDGMFVFICGKGEDGGAAANGRIAQDIVRLVAGSDDLAKALVAVDDPALPVEHCAKRRWRVDQRREHPPLRGQTARRFGSCTQAQEVCRDQTGNRADQQRQGDDEIETSVPLTEKGPLADRHRDQEGKTFDQPWGDNATFGVGMDSTNAGRR